MQVPELQAVVEQLQGSVQHLNMHNSDQQGQIQSLQDQRGNLEGQVTDLTGQNEDLTVQAAKVSATGHFSDVPCAPVLLPLYVAETFGSP